MIYYGLVRTYDVILCETQSLRQLRINLHSLQRTVRIASRVKLRKR